MLVPFTEKQKSLIVNNVVKACKDIEKLNGTGYKFIHLASGFIAHYNINGFKDHYTRYSLETDIVKNLSSNILKLIEPDSFSLISCESTPQIPFELCAASNGELLAKDQENKDGIHLKNHSESFPPTRLVRPHKLI